MKKLLFIFAFLYALDIHSRDTTSIQFTAEDSIHALSKSFATIRIDELKYELKIINYIVKYDMAKDYERILLEADADKIADFLARFWYYKSPKHFQKEREVYLDLVLKANKNFQSNARDGYLSDRGRIYIVYGPPNEIEMEKNNNKIKPYERWLYHKLDNGQMKVEFVFYNQHLNPNDFTLIHSNVKGELSNKDWKRQLYVEESNDNRLKNNEDIFEDRKRKNTDDF